MTYNSGYILSCVYVCVCVSRANESTDGEKVRRCKVASKWSYLGLSYHHSFIIIYYPLLRVLPTFVSEHTASTFSYVQVDCYQWLTHNKQRMLNHSPCLFKTGSVAYSYD
ncbi:hypothetical protein Y032_0005g2345 [Ancylostoma ceylanicum]|uniref:Uncharacterized protein n=1 Tax=Ancylostoma ceylanicum TaxID=53326 RepID=A0A016VRJ3_9BILA|nr:hypothetical protein Y032_0005g2345 [Ancylostoma ceylanicum]